MAFPALAEAEGKLKAKQDELGKVFEEAGEDLNLKAVKTLPAGVPAGDSAAIARFIREANDEMTRLMGEVENLKGVEAAAERTRTAEAGAPGGADGGGDPGGHTKQVESLGHLFLKSKAYTGRVSNVGPEATLDVSLADVKRLEMKTLMTTTAGWDPEETRTGRLVEFATRPIQVTDLIPTTTTGQSAVQYMEETTFTNAAAEVAEGGTYPEAALALTERTSLVRKIAVFLPVTDEQLEDEPQVRGYIDNRLPFMLRQRLDGQILTGSGVAPNLTGILNTAGIQTQAKGADPVPDAVYKALVKVRVTGRALPNATVFHPTDWQGVRLLRTADGLYIWGNPSDAGPERIWGLRVVQSDALTLGTALVGDFANFVELANRRGIDVQVSNSHGTFFIEGKQALRADLRAALIVYRPAAFCTVTGL